MDRIDRRRARPALDGLEPRTLLSGSRGQANAHALATSGTAAAVTMLKYTTGDGAKVQVQLKGPGTLAGSSINADGSLNLVYSSTSIFTTITGTVKGGSRVAPLASIRDANVPFESLTGIGGELLNAVALPQFNLIAGGNINLLGGVGSLSLNSVAADSQVHLRDVPLTTTLGFSSSYSTGDPSTHNIANAANVNQSTLTNGSTSSIGSVTTGSSGGVTNSTTGTASASTNPAITGAGTLSPVETGFGGGAVGGATGAIPIIPTVGNGQNNLGTPGLTQTQVGNGRGLTYTFAAGFNGPIQLTNVAGTFSPGSNLIEPRDVSRPGAPVPPPGVIVNIKHVDGGSTLNSPPLGDADIFGVDPTANALIRFDAVTGAALQTIPLPANVAGRVAGVALARNGNQLVALVGSGTTVLAYDAVFGTPVGQFSTANLSAEGFHAITGIGTGGLATVLVDATSGADGLAQAVNVAQSLATGQAVAAGASFAPGRALVLGGGITGVPGTGNLYALGSAFFDSAQPNQRLAGVLTLKPSASGSLSESARTSLTLQGLAVPANANGSITGDPSTALGAIESDLALVTAVRNGQNVVTLLVPSTLVSQGTINLADANALSDLSESFHPELANTALIDVQGNIQSFTAQDASGMVLNDAGNLNLLAIGTASNSSVIGLPFSHVDIKNRDNVSIVTSSRLVGDRGDVTINPGARQVGPLSLP